jgi:hypothetical protein
VSSLHSPAATKPALRLPPGRPLVRDDSNVATPLAVQLRLLDVLARVALAIAQRHALANPRSGRVRACRRRSDAVMTWVKLSDDLWRDPRIGGLSHQAFGLFVLLLCRSGELDSFGALGPADVRMVAGGPAKKEMDELVRGGFVTSSADGWQIAQPEEYLLSPDKVKERREQRARGRCRWWSRARKVRPAISRRHIRARRWHRGPSTRRAVWSSVWRCVVWRTSPVPRIPRPVPRRGGGGARRIRSGRRS